MADTLLVGSSAKVEYEDVADCHKGIVFRPEYIRLPFK